MFVSNIFRLFVFSLVFPLKTFPKPAQNLSKNVPKTWSTTSQQKYKKNKEVVVSKSESTKRLQSNASSR